MATDNQGVTRINPGRVVAGLIVLAVGVMMLLDRTDILRGHVAGRLLPGVVLIIIGVGQLAGGRRPWRGRRRGPFGGLWLIVIGAWLIASQAHLFGLVFQTSWPLLVIAAGVLMVLCNLFPGERQVLDEPGAQENK